MCAVHFIYNTFPQSPHGFSLTSFRSVSLPRLFSPRILLLNSVLTSKATSPEKPPGAPSPGHVSLPMLSEVYVLYFLLRFSDDSIIYFP